MREGAPALGMADETAYASVVVIKVRREHWRIREKNG
jgi:hypothetical protein